MKIQTVALHALAGLSLLAVGCGADLEPAEDTGENGSAVSSDGCKDANAYDEWISDQWNPFAVRSNAVDLHLGGQHLYNAYNYDSSRKCPQTFVTDLTARPNGNTKMKYRVTLGALDAGGAMSKTRCDHIKLEFVLYGTHFDGDNKWGVIANQYLSSTYANGKCELPSVTASVDYKGSFPGFGKAGTLRFALTGFDNDKLTKSCLALDGDDGGANLNSLCPVLKL